MKENISLDKDIIKVKGNGKKVIIPLDLREGKPWDEPNDEDAYVHCLYQTMKYNEDTIDPNDKGEIYLGSPMIISQKSNFELYNWHIDHSEAQVRDCWEIKEIP